MSYAYMFKYIILGDTGVGKSSLLMQFTERRSQESMEPTVGVEFGARMIVVGGEQIKLQIWDTCGQELFRAIVQSYYRETAGVLLVYDITRRDTFESVEMWMEQVRKHNHGNSTFILCGNKLDREAERQVTSEEAQAWAAENGALFVETSAVTADNVDKAFMDSASAIYGKIQRSELDCSDKENGVKVGVHTKATRPGNVVIGGPTGGAAPDDDAACC